MVGVGGGTGLLDWRSIGPRGGCDICRRGLATGLVITVEGGGLVAGLAATVEGEGLVAGLAATVGGGGLAMGLVILADGDGLIAGFVVLVETTVNGVGVICGFDGVDKEPTTTGVSTSSKLI